MNKFMNILGRSPREPRKVEGRDAIYTGFNVGPDALKELYNHLGDFLKEDKPVAFHIEMGTEVLSRKTENGFEVVKSRYPSVKVRLSEVKSPRANSEASATKSKAADILNKKVG